MPDTRNSTQADILSKLQAPLFKALLSGSKPWAPDCPNDSRANNRYVMVRRMSGARRFYGKQPRDAITCSYFGDALARSREKWFVPALAPKTGCPNPPMMYLGIAHDRNGR
jgi:hypothetical protein